MKTILRYAAAIPAALCLLAFSGCEQANNAEETYDTWDDTSWETDGQTTSATGDDYSWQDPDSPAHQPEVIADTHHEVIDKRVSGGEIIRDGGTSQLDGRPLERRTPQTFVIITRGNNTGVESAFKLSSSDFNVVQIGHRLQESTLQRWEKVTGDDIPPASKSTTADGQTSDRPYQVLDSGHIAY